MHLLFCTSSTRFTRHATLVPSGAPSEAAVAAAACGQSRAKSLSHDALSAAFKRASWASEPISASMALLQASPKPVFWRLLNKHLRTFCSPNFSSPQNSACSAWHVLKRLGFNRMSSACSSKCPKTAFAHAGCSCTAVLPGAVGFLFFFFTILLKHDRRSAGATPSQCCFTSASQASITPASSLPRGMRSRKRRGKY